MKKALFSILLLFGTIAVSFAQDFTALSSPPEGKCIVYFVRNKERIIDSYRYSFLLTDGPKFIARIYSKSYITYECKPGDHVFIGEINNRVSYMEANLEANRVYIVEISDIKGNYMSLLPLDKNNKKHEKKLIQACKFIDEKLGTPHVEVEYNVEQKSKNFDKYNKKKAKNNQFKQLTLDMYVNNSNQ